MRDGISILDQCIATGKNPLKLEDVHEIIGVAPNLLILDTAGFLTECKSKEAVEAIDQLISAGKDPAQFLQGMIQMFRDILVYKAGNSVEPLLSMTAEERTRVPILAGKVSVAEALMVVRELSDLEAGIRWSTSPRILLEMAFLRICERELNRDTDKLLDQLKLLEQRIRKLEEGIPAGHISARPATAATMPATAADAPSCTCPKPAEQQTKPQANAEALNREPFQEWDKVMDQLMRNKHMTLFTYLCVAKAVWKDENTIWIVLSDEDGKQKEFLSSAENMDITIRTIRECTGKDLQVELFKADKTGKKASKTEVPENVIQFAAKSGLKLDIVDE